MLKMELHNLDCLDLIDQLDDESVDLFLLDPPYFMGKKPFVNRAKQYERVVEEWDNQWETLEGYLFWVNTWLTSSWDKLKPGGSILITGTFHNIFDIRNELTNTGYTFRNFVTWFKPNAMPIMLAKQMGVYAYSCEYVLYYTKGKKAAYYGYDYLKELNDGKQHRDIFIISNRPHSESVGHPTQKPLKLWRSLVQAHCHSNGLVVDFFAGSGTTGVAALETGRNYIMGEINENYCKMIEERIEDVTSNLAERIQGEG